MKWGKKEVLEEWANEKNPYIFFFCRGDFRPFLSKIVQIWDYFFPLLFPKQSEYLKRLDIGLWELGAKKPLNGVRKCDGQTDKQTNKQTYGHFDL